MMKLFTALAICLAAIPALAQEANFAAVNKGEVVEMGFYAARPADTEGRTWLPLEYASTPDPATQVITGSSVQVLPDRVRISYTVEPRSAGEIDVEKSRAVDGVDIAVIRALCNHENRIRALQTPPAGALSFAQCKAAFKTLLP